MRKTVSAVVLAACAFAATIAVSPAMAVCGGEPPGQPCYCPDRIQVGGKTYYTGINC